MFRGHYMMVKSKLVIQFFFFAKSTLNWPPALSGTLQSPFHPPAAEIGTQEEYQQIEISVSESALLQSSLF